MKYRSEKDLANRPRGEMVKKYLNERGFRILDALDQVASRYHSVPAVVSLAWLIARPDNTDNLICIRIRAIGLRTIPRPQYIRFPPATP